MESKRRNLLQILRIEKAFGMWKALINPPRKCPAASMGVSGTGFMTSQRLNMAELANYVSCELHAIESGFIAQIKQNINILRDFDMSHLKNKSLWIN